MSRKKTEVQETWSVKYEEILDKQLELYSRLREQRLQTELFSRGLNVYLSTLQCTKLLNQKFADVYSANSVTNKTQSVEDGETETT